MQRVELPDSDAFSLLAELDILTLSEMLEASNIYVSEQSENVRQEITTAKPEQYESEYDYSSHLDSLNDELLQLENIKGISKKLLVVGLHMVIENSHKRLFKWLYHQFDGEIRDKKLQELHKWRVLKSELVAVCNTALTDVCGYSVIDELRCLSNAIKHGGYVKGEISKFPKWKADLNKEINADKINLEEYYANIPVYIRDLVGKVKANLA